MNTIHSKKRSRLLLADLAAWERENGEDNALRLERLRRNLRQARLQELTGRQQQVLTLRGFLYRCHTKDIITYL